MLARDEFPLHRTPLHALHVARGGKIVPFAGYEMPVQYAAGVLREHQHTRSAAGLWSVPICIVRPRRERPALVPAPKEQPPRKLSGKRTAWL